MSNNFHPPGLVLVGGGGHSCVVREAAELSGWQIVGYYDDEDRTRWSGVSRLGRFQDFLIADGNVAVILAVGNLSTRERMVQRYHGPLATIIHPAAIVSRRATIGEGAFVAAAAVINPASEVGRHAIINTRAVVEHDCRLAANCHIGPGAVLGGGVSLGANTLIGISACVKPNIHVGRNCVVGAGAVVTQDVKDGSIVIGVPARPIPSRLRKSA